MEPKCPKCQEKLVIQKRNIDDSLVKLVLYCPHCGYYKELIVRPKKKEEKETSSREGVAIILPLKESPSNAPKPIKFIFSKARENNFLEFTPIFYEDLYTDPPELGIEVSSKALASLGLTYIADKICRSLQAKGIKRLYKFQENAIRFICKGYNTVIVAQTAMGKTEAFLLPALNVAYISEERPSVLIVYPTKALARDQLDKIKYYADPLGISVAVLDGDTPSKERRRILMDPPSILITNFDMIHYWLPRITKNKGIPRLFLSAKLLVLDEVHVYAGAFGSHVHYIIKRLRRLIESPGRKLQIVLASATISNPEEFSKMLIGEDVKVVVGRGRRVSLGVLFLYTHLPPFIVGAKILIELVKHGIKTLAFYNTRSSAELTYSVTKRAKLPEIISKISVHRAGIPARIRTKIEQDFKGDRILGIISTPTLELGIDIGNVMAVISEMTPVDRFIQRSGRAGRRGEKGAAVLLLRAGDPISEYYAMNPKDYFKDISGRYLEPRNMLIAKQHIYLMAYERPLRFEEVEKYDLPREAIEELENEHALFRTKGGWIANGAVFSKYFSRNIRGIDVQVDVYCRGKKIDQREILIALKELYPGAIYLNRGTKYIVRSLDLPKLRALVELAPPEYQSYYTKPLYSYSATPIGNLEEKHVCGTLVYHGLLRMRISVWGYLIFREGQKEPIAQNLLDEPIQYTYNTYGLFFLAPPYTGEDKDAIAGAYHATEHILIEGTYVISGGSEYDLGGISFGTSGLIVIHEALPGGNGISSLLFNRFRQAVEKAYKILSSPICRSKEFLNKCVFSYHCGNNNKPLNQKGAKEILQRMMSNEEVPNAEKAPSLLEKFDKGIV